MDIELAIIAVIVWVIVLCIMFLIKLSRMSGKIENQKNSLMKLKNYFQKEILGVLNIVRQTNKATEKQIMNLTSAVRQICPHNEVKYNIEDSVNGYTYIIKTCCFCGKNLAQGYVSEQDGLELWLEYLKTKTDFDTKEIEKCEKKLSEMKKNAEK